MGFAFRICVWTASLAVAVGGPLFSQDWNERLSRTRDRVLRGGPPYYTPSFLLADVVPQEGRRFTNFSGDLSGRYLSGLAALCPQDREACAALQSFVLEVLPHQKPEGYFGDPAAGRLPEGLLESWLTAGWRSGNDHMALLWGNGRLLVGLVEAWQVSQDSRILKAAERLGDYLRRAAEVWDSPLAAWRFRDRRATGYICWTQTAEGLALLAEATGEQQYREAAYRAGSRLERVQNQHSHGYLSTMRALTRLAATGAKTEMQQVEAAWQGVVDSQNVTPARVIPEMFRPFDRRDEGCSNADWVRWTLDLWRATGKLGYLEEAERAIVNGFALSQLANGDFGHRSFAPGGFQAGAERAWWCCTLHGLRALADIRKQAVRRSGSSVLVELPMAGEWEGFGSAGLLRVSLQQGDRELRVRAPEWAETVAVEGTGWEPAGEDGGYRIWRRANGSSREAAIRYRFRWRTQATPEGWLLWYGPWLMAVNEKNSPAFFDEPMDGNRLATLPDQGTAVVPGAAGYPQARIGFLQGGYGMQPAEAVLEPLAAGWQWSLAPQWRYAFRLQQSQ